MQRERERERKKREREKKRKERERRRESESLADKRRAKRQISTGCGHEERERERKSKERKQKSKETERQSEKCCFGHGMMVVVSCVLCFLSPHEALLCPASSVFLPVG